MSYNSNIPQQKYVASAGQTDFTFLFKVFQESDLTVYNVAPGDDPEDAIPLTLNVDYTVIINGDLGGSVTLTVGASDGASITLYRRLDIVRYVEYQTSGDLLADTLNADQDYQTYLVADLADAVKEDLSGDSPGAPVGDFVQRRGDTMTGNLYVPSLLASSSIYIQGNIVDNVNYGIEVESNSDMRCIKFPDGTMIIKGIQSTNTGVGGRTITFLVPFTTSPSVQATPQSSTPRIVVLNESPTNTQCVIRGYNLSGDASDTNFRWIAIGRWK